MSVTSQIHSAGHPTFTLTHGDQEVVVSAFGGQINSWTKAGKPCIFGNADRVIVDGKTAYRGGAPVCFPFFGKGTLLPLGTTQSSAHGKARVSIWDVQVLESKNAVVLTNSQPSAEGYGPTEFTCEIGYTLGEQLTIRATITNVGENESPFQIAFHTYWATDEPSNATVKGLGNRYLDNLLGLTEQQEPDSSLPHPIPFDRIYLDDEPRQVLNLGHVEIDIVTKGCSGSVLWNPGKDHTIKDLGSPDFVCLESGLITPCKTLAQAEEHVVEISYSARLV
jgi:D-hexose-6-phosphate mutarotase